MYRLLLNSTIWTVAAVFLSITAVNAQVVVNKTGSPYVKSFNRNEFGGGTQTWSITQDDRGVVYFGNNNGVLEYDGYTWRKVTLENGSIVRKVYKSNDGRIYLGAFNELGYLEPDSIGNLIYKSLVDLMPKSERAFGEVWSIVEYNGSILFQSFSHLFLLRDNKISLLSQSNFNYLHQCNGVNLIADNEKGLFDYVKGVLNKVEGGSVFSEKTLVNALPIGSTNKIILGSSYNGLYVKDNATIVKWDCDASDFVMRNQLYCMIQLDSDLYAAGTIKDGIVFFNTQGEIVRHLNKDSGLQNNSILSLFLDADKNLWIGLDNGIDLINMNSPVSKLFSNEEYGTGYVSSHKGDYVYFGTNIGLYYSSLSEMIDSEKEAMLKPIIKAQGQVWNMQIIDDVLLCGHHNGAYVVTDNRVQQISDVLGFWKFVELPNKPEYIIASTYTGLVLFKKADNPLTPIVFVCEISGFNESCRDFECDEFGNLWLSNPYVGVYKITLSNDLQGIESLEYFDSDKGLPSDYQNFIAKIDQSIQVFTKKGVYTFNSSDDIFEKNTQLTNVLGDVPIDRIKQDDYGNIWYFQNNELGLLRSNFKGVYYAEKVPYNELKRDFISGFESVHSIENKSLLISNEFGFVHFNKANSIQLKDELHISIRKVKSNEEEIIFGGSFSDGSNLVVSEMPHNKHYILPFEQNNIHVTVSTLSYYNSDKIAYRYLLGGRDETWSEWAYSNSIAFFSLSAGSYDLKIQARNHYNVESEVTNFRFKIEKPWYWNAASILVYVLIFILIVYFIYRLVIRHFEKEQEVYRLKQIEKIAKKEKEFKYENILKEQEITKLTNENLVIVNDKNRVQLENKTKELASIAMKISSTNDVINRTRTHLTKVQQQMVHEESKKQVGRLINSLEAEVKQQDNWREFEVHFDQVHENFLKQLRKTYSSLTSKDLKTAAYLRMNMSTKEIAQLFNLTYRGVETSRFRLRKKLQLTKDENLTEFLMNFTGHKGSETEL